MGAAHVLSRHARRLAFPWHTAEGECMGILQDRIAVVTGSTRGIGAAIAEAFAREGARVVVHGRDQQALEAVTRRIQEAGGTAMGRSADVTRPDELQALRASVEQEWGPVDLLVANAGGSLTPPGPFEQLTLEGWQRTVEANLTGTFLTLQTFLPRMKELGRGVILTMSSAAARRPHPQSPVPYAAAKAGIQMLTQHLAAQVGPYGIRVNCIAPETILTERNQQQIPAEMKEKLVALHPIRRLGLPDDVAKACVFLASEQAAWITGLILDVSGGAVMV